jgi:hypothetical protein
MSHCISKISRKSISFSVLSWVALTALLGSAISAEASRRHSVRPPASLVIQSTEAAEATVAETATVEEAAPETTAVEESVPARKRPAPKRGLFDLLFGRGDRATGPAVASGVRFDGRMVEAARLAEKSARRRSINRCWRFVKNALRAAEVIECYPKTALAKQAAVELPERYGFKELDVTDPHAAPVGAVLVYGGRGAGHVEIRTETGFVSDHASLKPSPRPLIGVFVKPVEG